MQRLRHSTWIARLVLVWFALFVGVAVAAPLVSPDAMQMVCSGSGGMKIVVPDQGDDALGIATGLDCPLCATVLPPPVSSATRLPFVSPLAHALQPVAAAHIASVSAPPLPSRGPPSIA